MFHEFLVVGKNSSSVIICEPECRLHYNFISSQCLLADDMLQHENSPLRDRVHDLERRVVEQVGG